MGIVIQQSQKVLTEPLDRNKTGITHQVTASAIAYLVDRGLHPVETEVSVERSWIVDVAGFGYPIQNELKKLHLTGKRPIIPPISHIESYYLRYGSLLTAIIEVKTTRQDYLGDWKFKSKVYPANLCYLAYPKDLIKPEEIPEGCGYCRQVGISRKI